MAITFSNNFEAMSPADKAREYNRLLREGNTDASIIQAANQAFGQQSKEGIAYLQGLATKERTPEAALKQFTSAPAEVKAQTYLGALARGQTPEEFRLQSSGLFGYQSPEDLQALTRAMETLPAQQKAQVYNQALGSGLTEAQIRANIDNNFGRQTNEAWNYVGQLASNQRGAGGGAGGGAAGGAAGSGAAGGGAAANPYTPQALTNPFTYTPNPYLGEMAGTIRQQVTDNLQRNILPGIGSAAIAAGGYGGSRQGVVEANALKDANQGLSNSLANLYGQDYNSAMGRGLQKYQGDQNYNMGLGNLGLGFQNSAQNFALGVGGLANQRYGQDQNYALGMGNLGLGYQNSLQNFYTNQRGQDMQGMQLGANLVQQGNTGMQQQGQGLYNLGLTQQQAPWNVVGNYTNTVSPFTGFGNTTNSTPGNAVAGALGGATVGAQLYNIFNKP